MIIKLDNDEKGMICGGMHWLEVLLWAAGVGITVFSCCCRSNSATRDTEGESPESRMSRLEAELQHLKNPRFGRHYDLARMHYMQGQN